MLRVLGDCGLRSAELCGLVVRDVRRPRANARHLRCSCAARAAASATCASRRRRSRRWRRGWTCIRCPRSRVARRAAIVCGSAASRVSRRPSRSEQAVHKLVRACALVAGVPEWLAHPHGLRTYWATSLLEDGVPPPPPVQPAWAPPTYELRAATPPATRTTSMTSPTSSTAATRRRDEPGVEFQRRTPAFDGLRSLRRSDGVSGPVWSPPRGNSGSAGRRLTGPVSETSAFRQRAPGGCGGPYRPPTAPQGARQRMHRRFSITAAAVTVLGLTASTAQAAKPVPPTVASDNAADYVKSRPSKLHASSSDRFISRTVITTKDGLQYVPYERTLQGPAGAWVATSWSSPTRRRRRRVDRGRPGRDDRRLDHPERSPPTQAAQTASKQLAGPSTPSSAPT